MTKKLAQKYLSAQSKIPRYSFDHTCMNMIMRWGLPPDNMKYEDRPYVRELRAKSDKEFNAYLALFTRHLCEPEIGNSPTYADGIPKEGMQRQMVLFRIGIMSLIKKKVEEFEAITQVLKNS